MLCCVVRTSNSNPHVPKCTLRLKFLSFLASGTFLSTKGAKDKRKNKEHPICYAGHLRWGGDIKSPSFPLLQRGRFLKNLNQFTLTALNSLESLCASAIWSVVIAFSSPLSSSLVSSLFLFALAILSHI